VTAGGYHCIPYGSIMNFLKNLKVLPKLMLIFGVNLLLFLTLLFISYDGFTTMIEARNSALHANEVIRAARRIELNLLQLRADKRDFLITGEVRFFEQLKEDLANVEAELGSLRERTEGNQRHQTNLDLFQDRFGQWLDNEVHPMLRDLAEGRKQEEMSDEYLLSEPGREAFEASRKALAGIRDQERNALGRHTQEMMELQSFTTVALLGGGVLAILAGTFLLVMVSLVITRPLGRITAYARRVALGDHTYPLDIDQKDEIGILAKELRAFQRSMIEKARVTEAIAEGDLSPSLDLASDKDSLGLSINRMTAALRQARDENARTDWVKTGLNELASRGAGESDARSLAGRVLSFLAPYLNAQIATLYLLNENGALALYGGYAVDPVKVPADDIKIGQGLVGQAAQERTLISVSPIPEDYLRINSSLGESAPRSILAVPFTHRDSLVGVLEIGSFEPFPEHAVDFLKVAAESMGIAFDSLNKQARVRELLERTQQQALQLQEQQEELKAANEELEEHTQTLQQSEEELKQQREELQVINEELEEKNESLERQKALIQEKNRDLENAWGDIRRKAAELEASSRYKSEFLANMSHELRTPLNSLLLLARSLRDNSSGTLSAEDVEAAGIIHKNGTDLLNLINDILDLSKIEAGKMSVQRTDVHLAEVAGNMMVDFRHLAEEKGLFLKTLLDDDLPSSILTDRQRLEQILRNILSNGVKFTKRGGITMHFYRPKDTADPRLAGLDPEHTVAFEVADTGIGIPAEKQQEVFKAFQQADGGTSRRFGGTGLGLTISRQLAHLLGGEITIQSDPGKGSTFTLYLPTTAETGKRVEPEPKVNVPEPDLFVTPLEEVVPAALKSRVPVPSIPDDRETAGENDRVILIIEDDLNFANILLNLCHRKGFKAVASPTGEEGLILADRFMPTGIILDIRLPGISGWTVLNSLKGNHKTRHIPVHIISVHDAPQEALIMGAVGFLSKPVDGEELERAFGRIEDVVEKKVKDLLLVEDNADLRKGIHKLLSDLEVKVTEAETGQQAIEAIRRQTFDCMILDLGLADMSGFDLLKLLEKEQKSMVPPVIVYTGKELTREEERELRKYAETIIVKGARSEERLLDEATLFLHRMVGTLPQAKQRMIINLHNRDAALEGRKVLLVDDDMRNLFALSRVLSEKGLHVVKAEDGAAALEVLDKEPQVDIVFMDIMMPGMDGYEAMRRIRGQSRFAKLPIIALTAKAMKEDREKCLEAGANDYLAKPVDIDKMLSMMRVWLYRR
jgi:CheY-like chemotaxis protein/signal transduction histidine kinase/CHASE3 domain sensor protein